MKDISLKSEILDVLKDISVTSFTVDELTETYLQHPSSLHTSKKAARQFVYRNMQRLMKVGYMERLKADGRWPHYALTQKFLQLYKATHPAPLSPLPIVETDTVQLNTDPLASLKERLKMHQAEVLTAMGEMEEYEAICQEMPDLREIAQPRYNESRERCSRLLGRVRPDCSAYLTDVMDAAEKFQAHRAFYAFREDEWDGMDYELPASLRPGQFYWLTEQGKQNKIPRNGELMKLLKKRM